MRRRWSPTAAQPPTLYADASATADVTQQARDVLARIDGMVADNETALHAVAAQHRDRDLDAGARIRSASTR